MEEYLLDETKSSPKVRLDPHKGLIELSGRSVPENAFKFFKPVLEWVGEYAKNPQPESKVRFDFDYLNTTSSKCILDLLFRLGELAAEGKTRLEVNWHVNENDEDMIEAAEDYAEAIEVPINIIKNKD